MLTKHALSEGYNVLRMHLRLELLTALSAFGTVFDPSVAYVR